LVVVVLRYKYVRILLFSKRVKNRNSFTIYDLPGEEDPATKSVRK